MGPSRNGYDPFLEDNDTKLVTIDGRQYSLEFFSIDAVKEYIALKRQMILDSHGALLVYSITSAPSLFALGQLHREIKEVKVEQGMWDPFQIAVVGNKSDLQDQRVIPTEQGRDYAQKLGCAFEECSAKTSENLEKIAVDLVKRIITYRDNERIRYEQIQQKALRNKDKKPGVKGLLKKIFK